MSYSMLSTKNKINWPVLLSECDEQGRFVAESKFYKGTICPNIDEIVRSDIDELLNELASLEMIVLYERNEIRLGQLVNYWTYNPRTWATASKYPPPDGWTDRIKERRGKEIFTRDWDKKGGFPEITESNSNESNVKESKVIESTTVDHTMVDHSMSDDTMTASQLSSLWKEIQSNLKGRLDKATFNEYFYNAELIEVKQDYVVIRFPNRLKMEWVQGRMMEHIVPSSVELALGRTVAVHLEAKE